MIYDITPVDNYKGNNLSTQFDFDFYIENKDQLRVYLFNENKTKIELEYNVDYSINEFKNKNGSFITFPLASSVYGVLSDKEEISIELTLPISQETQFNNSSLLNFESLEYALDYLTRLIQIIARKLKLCVKVEECSNTTPDELIEAINSSALSAVEAANNANKNLNKIIEQKEEIKSLKNDIETINDEIEINKEKFDSIDVLANNHNILNESKLNKDHSNDTKPYIIDTYKNDTSWYRVWSDGWCEQGGFQNKSGTQIYLKTFEDTNYCLLAKGISTYSTAGAPTGSSIIRNYTQSIQGWDESSFTTSFDNNFKMWWKAEGYLAQGEY